MALSSRELLLILRARDEASRVVRSFAQEFANVNAAAQKAARSQIAAGSALVSVGVGIGAVGVAGLAWLKGSTDAAVEFNKQVAYTSTQLDKVGASQKSLGDIIKRTGRDIAVPIEQLHQGLYDIFSSMNVTVPQSEALLRSFAKEAVAGQVELKDAARSTIGILNAFHLSVDQVTRVQDVQFQLVRKGVGTYEEFARVMGRATPSAARAGQSVEVLAGMLAYLTRNGLSAAMASASAGRAFDAFSHPSTVKRLQAMGIAVTDNEGNFRKFTDVIVDLQAEMANMTAPERAAALKELFKSSGGTIQARRFYDMVLKDKASVDQFVGLVGDMENASGSFAGAYNTMANTTASKSQLIQNQWQLLRVEVGEAFIPALSKLMEIISGALHWWNSLDEGLRKQIITWVAIGSAIAVVVGIMTVMAGAFLMLAGAAAMVGIGLGALLAIMAGIVVGIAAIIAIAVVLIKNWDSVTAALGAAWNWLWGILRGIFDWFMDHIGFKLVEIWNKVSSDIINGVRAVGEWVHKVWTNIANWAEDIWPGIRAVIEPIINWFIHVWPFLEQAIVAVLRLIADTFLAVWDAIVAVLKGAWIAISGIIEGIITIFRGIIDFIVGIFTLDFDLAFRGLVQIVVGFGQIIIGIFVGLWEMVKGLFIAALDFLGSVVSNGLVFIWNIIRTVIDGIVQFFQRAWDWIVSIAVTAWNNISGAATSFWNGLKSGFQSTVDTIGKIWNGILDVLATPVNFVIGIIYNKGIKWLWDKIADFLGLGHLPDVKQLDHGAHFRNGGPVYGPGGPRDDMINAWLSNGEYVMPADKTRRYRPLLDAMRAGYNVIPGFADGGPVGKVLDWVGNASKQVVGWLTDPVGSVVNAVGSGAKAVRDIAQVPAHLIGTMGERFWNLIAMDQSDPNSITSRMIANGTIVKLLDGDVSSESIGMINTVLQGWGRQQAGKRYLWGAVGPNNYDCSGLVGNLWAIATGNPLYRRYFTTASMGTGKFGMQRGPGNFTIYLNRAGGHTAANVGGFHMEAYNGDGTPLAIGRVGTPLTYYNEIMHLYADGGFVSLKNNPQLRLASWLDRGWPEPTLFDTGGIWKHGTLGLNMSGGDEIVTRPDQMRELLDSRDRRGDTYMPITIHTNEIDPRVHAAEIGWEITNGRVV
jgi:TP901 family phage tail tape measure protein